MSLKLDPVAAAPVTQKADPIVDRCSGRSWALALGGVCGSDTFAAVAPPVVVAEAPSPAEATATATDAAQDKADQTTAGLGESFTGFGLPSLGSLSAARFLRAAREFPAEAGKAFEAVFRFASKYRLTSTGEGWEVSKFKDVMSENRTQASGVKAVGVELMLPFQ